MAEYSDDLIEPIDESDESIDNAISTAVAPYHNKLLMTPNRGLQDNYTLVKSNKRGKKEREVPEYHYGGQYVRPEMEDLKWKLPKRKKGDHAIDTGMSALKDIVGSKLARDIKRRVHFMSPETFAPWNAKYGKRRDGTGKYWVDNVDLDDDHMPEFVVGRTDREGKKLENDIIAVNGWTTTKSDYPVRRAYLDRYPRRDQRIGETGKKFKDFVNEYYLTEEAMSENGWFPKHEYVRDRQLKMDKNYKYNLRMPNPTAYQVFMKEVIWTAYKIITTELTTTHNVTSGAINDVCNKNFKQGWIVKAGKAFFDNWIMVPYLDALSQDAAYEKYKEEYLTKLRRIKKNAAFKEENFIKWLLKQTSVREGLNNIVAAIVDSESEEYDNAIDYLINWFKQKIESALGKTSPPLGKYQHR